MTVRSLHLKIAGVAGAAALAVGALAAPGMAANHNLSYNCSSGAPAPLGPIDSTLNPGAIPKKMTAGQSIKNSMTLTFHLNAQQTAIAASFGDSVKGSVSTKGALAFKLKIPTTAIPQTLGDTLDASASGKGTVTAAKAGKFKVNAGKADAVLNISGGTSPLTATQTCSAPTDGSQKLATVTVAQDKTKSKVSGKVKGKKATVSDKVTSHFGLVPTGKVSFTLKKGSKSVKATGKLSKKGVATISKSLASGKYSVTASYKGDKNVKGSTGKGSITVK